MVGNLRPRAKPRSAGAGKAGKAGQPAENTRWNLWPEASPQTEKPSQAAPHAVSGRVSPGGFDMTVRVFALVCLGWLAGSGIIPTAARAAGEPFQPAALTAAVADAGSSSREARRLATEAVPLARMPPAERQIAEQAIKQTTLYRHLPAASITCDAALIDFILTKPETLVDVWRVLGISRLALDPVGPGQWRLSDGYGTTGTVRLLHQERNDRGGVYVFHGRGGYNGPLSPKQLSGSCLVVVRHSVDVAPVAGRPGQTMRIDAFLDVDGVGLEIVTRTLQPLIVRSAAANLHEISLFVSQFAAAASRNPAAVARLTDRMSRTNPEDRRTLVTLASGRHGSGSPTVARQPVDADVQTELAARWMTAEQLDGMQR